jgi:hypothetical protein
VICPQSLQACADDICLGNGCLLMGDAPMLFKCQKCGELGEDWLAWLCKDCLNDKEWDGDYEDEQEGPN